MRGTVTNWFFEKGFGWIKPDGKPFDLYAHATEVQDGQTSVYVGATVEFTEHEARESTTRGRRPFAKNIKIVS